MHDVGVETRRVAKSQTFLPISMAFDTVAIWAAAFMGIPGVRRRGSQTLQRRRSSHTPSARHKEELTPNYSRHARLLRSAQILFMAKHKDTASNAAAEANFSLNEQALSLASYYLFLAGMMLCALGFYSVGLALDLPAPLAATAALSGPLSVLGFMAIMKTSITGIPGISGPPLPARVALLVVGCILNGNAIAVALDGTKTAWATFGIIYVLAMGIPQAIALKHRSAAPASL